MSFQYPATPPPPPPKPSSVPQADQPFLPHPPPNSQAYDSASPYSALDANVSSPSGTVDGPPEGWLPNVLKDTSTTDLQHVHQNGPLQDALVHSPTTAHPSIASSRAPLESLLAANAALATSLSSLETHLKHQRQATQSRLLSLRALEAQWRAKQAEQDAALRDFSPPALYQRLSAAVAEKEALCRGLEESFLDGADGAGDSGGLATEREVSEFVRRLTEGRKTAYLRRERKERWDEGRVGGWR